MFNEYPYRNIEDLNLDYLQARVRNLEKIVAQFVALESVTFADPIQWRITKQYAKNVVVLDEHGNAFISKEPVPTGVYLTNEDYWLEIFNFMDYVKSFNSNLTFNIESNTDRASVPYSVGDWLLLDDVLYKVLVAIPADGLFEIGVNIEHFTVENFIKAWINYANGLIVQYKNDIDASELLYRQQLAGDIASTTASLQAQLDAAIAGATVDSEVINARIGEDGVTYSTLGDAIRTQIEKVKRIINEIKNGVISVNKFDPSAATAGYYVDYNSGNLVSHINYYASDFIPIEGGEKYVIASNGNQQGAYYDENFVYISGFATSNSVNNVAVPNNARYVRFTIDNANISNCYFVHGPNFIIVRDLMGSSRYNITLGLVADAMASDRQEVIVNVTNITGLANALYLLGASTSSDIHTTIYLAEGTYNVTLSILTTYNQATYGLVLPDNVDLIGLGKGATIICDLTGESAGVQSMISTINPSDDNKIENVTFIANNCRYAMHNDFMTKPSTQIFKNCKFVHEGCSDGNWTTPAAVGEGTKSGANVTYDNCTFIGDLRAYYLHNNINFTSSSYHIFVNCKFTAIGSAGKYSVVLESMKSTVNDYIDFIGCSFTNLINGSVSNQAPPGTVDNDFIVNFAGCSPLPINFYFPGGDAHYPMTENSEYFLNDTGSTINALTPLKMAYGKYIPLTTSDDFTKVVAIACYKNVPNGDYGILVKHGYINIQSITSGLGDKIGIVNGALAVVNNDSYIGITKFKDSLTGRTYLEI